MTTTLPTARALQVPWQPAFQAHMAAKHPEMHPDSMDYFWHRETWWAAWDHLSDLMISELKDQTKIPIQNR